MNRTERRQQARSNKKKKNLSSNAQIELNSQVKPLLEAMEDGNEYASIVNTKPPAGVNLVEYLKQAISEIQAVRQKPCLAYVGNVINGKSDSGVIAKDDLPFQEMVQSVPEEDKEVDIFLATQGGSGPQIARFVNALRERFERVNFLIPSFCMSAGTLFALSGDEIWMNPQACLGPIDPQVPNAEGRFVPAQALLLLVQELEKTGQAGINAGTGVPWTAVRIIDSIDKKDLGTAISSTEYSKDLAVRFLMNYKFKHWKIRRTSQQPVTQEYRYERASTIASALASHERWRNHGHALSREVLWNEIKLEIKHPDAALERVMRRTWALSYWLFDKTPIQKIIVSENYSYIMFDAIAGV